jgi:hypothetical protein
VLLPFLEMRRKLLIRRERSRLQAFHFVDGEDSCSSPSLSTTVSIRQFATSPAAPYPSFCPQIILEAVTRGDG